MSIATVLAEGRLIRGAYAQTAEDGRQLLCALTALYDNPDARPGQCDAHLCPKWLQHLLPWLDDSGTEERWPEFMRRLAAIAPRFAGMDEATSRKLDLTCRRIALIEALPRDAAGVVQPVIDLIDRELHGDAPTTQEWASAREAVASAEWAAAARASASAEAADRMIDAMLAEMERSLHDPAI